MRKALFMLCSLWGGVVQAQSISVESASTYPAKKGENVAVALVLRNPGEALELRDVSTSVAQLARFRVHLSHDGVAQIFMPLFLNLPARSRIHLLPGANEIYLSNLTQPLVAGTEFPLLLTLAPSQTLTVRVQVKPDLPSLP